MIGDYNNELTFLDWKTVFLSHRCKKKYCMNNGKVEYGCCCCDFSDIWKKKTMYVREKDIRLVPYFGGGGGRQPRWSSVALKMHPLVEKGVAYWIYENTLLIGYTLSDNKDIWRPIFSEDREKALFNVRNAIKKYVGNDEKCNIGNGFIRKLRQNIAKRELLAIKKLSLDNIMMISTWL